MQAPWHRVDHRSRCGGMGNRRWLTAGEVAVAELDSEDQGGIPFGITVGGDVGQSPGDPQRPGPPESTDATAQSKYDRTSETCMGLEVCWPEGIFDPLGGPDLGSQIGQDDRSRITMTAERDDPRPSVQLSEGGNQLNQPSRPGGG